MVISMTGFSSANISIPIKDAVSGSGQTIQASLTLKTLNSRFFETSCRLPNSLSFFETELIRYFKNEFMRGTIQFTIYMSSPSLLTGVVEPALPTVEGYLSALNTIKKKFSLEGAIEIGDVMHLPNIFETKEAPLEQETVDLLWKAIHDLTKKCQEARIQEGVSLAKDLKERIDSMAHHMAQLEPRAKEFIEQKKNQLIENLRAILLDVSSELSAESQISSIFNQLERIDIHEELVRFTAHLDSLKEVLESSEISKGKKVDFILQELFRETNTIASKCSDAQISNYAISIKVELEKAREQAQNIV